MNVFAFPFYSDKLKQARFSSVCSKFRQFELYSAPNRFLPFMIKKPSDGQLIDCIKIFGLDDVQLYTITPSSFSYQMYSDSAYDYIFYYAGIVSGMSLPCGQYYLQIGGYFSEVFTVHADVTKLLKLEFRHEGNVGEAIYQNGFFQRLYFDTVLADPKYKISQEGDENGDNEFIATFTSVVKKHKVETVLVPEYLADVLNLLAAHNEVTIGDIQGAKQIETETEWLVSGCFANVEINFQEADSVFSKNCSDPVALSIVDQSGYVPKPWLCGDPTNATPYWQNTGDQRCVTIENVPRTTAWRGVDPYCETT